jgi:hypothetical protein
MVSRNHLEVPAKVRYSLNSSSGIERFHVTNFSLISLNEHDLSQTTAITIGSLDYPTAAAIRPQFVRKPEYDGCFQGV